MSSRIIGALMALAMSVTVVAADKPTSTASEPEQKKAPAPAASTPDRKRPHDQHRCMSETGSRIPGHCSSGTVVTKEELERTGEADMSRALSRAVPGVGSSSSSQDSTH